jgi:hypothetical protein
MDDDIHFLASKLSRISRSRDGKAAFIGRGFFQSFSTNPSKLHNNNTAAANLIKSS